MSKTGNWRGAEYCLADILKKFKLPAYRKLARSGNFALKDTDVAISGFEDEFMADSKYSKARPFRHHSLLEVIEEKYCPRKEQFGILFTKNYKQRGGCITIRAEFFAMLLAFWLGFGNKEELMNIYLKKEVKNDLE